MEMTKSQRAARGAAVAFAVAVGAFLVHDAHEAANRAPVGAEAPGSGGATAPFVPAHALIGETPGDDATSDVFLSSSKFLPIEVPAADTAEDEAEYYLGSSKSLPLDLSHLQPAEDETRTFLPSSKSAPIVVPPVTSESEGEDGPPPPDDTDA